ncbi:MinD-like ATPase involved in chromosome partitioning or flagellar assembly [Mycobacterium sp. MAA66]|uniref:MinD/ParA family ATP-binding protein n=1 Tax=Mycobacterium sp. MAA66 TaxID=3156297 RepID=UPI0035198E57
MTTDNDQHFHGTDTVQADATVTAAPSDGDAQTSQFPPVPAVLAHPAVPANVPYAPYGGAEHYAPQYGTQPQPQGHWPGLRMSPDAVAKLGLPTATETMASVTARSVARPAPRRGWRHALYATTRINLGRSRDELYERDLYARVRRNVLGPYQIGVLGLKGGAGKTSVTVTLGSLLARVRGDRILAVDADPDCGNLADRAHRRPETSILDLLSDKNIRGYNDLRAYTVMNDANLEVLASPQYSLAGRDFDETDWTGTVEAVSPYYNLVLADCGTGLFHSATRGVLSTVSDVVIVTTATVDGARQAAVTMDWLRQNGYEDLVSRSCVVINHVTKGAATVDTKALIAQFERHIMPGRVINLPWDKHIAAGVAIDFDLLGDTYKRRIAELAAVLSDDFGANIGQ